MSNMEPTKENETEWTKMSAKGNQFLLLINLYVFVYRHLSVENLV